MLTRLLLVVGCASALRVPVKPQTTASMGRREFASVAAMGALFGLPMAAPAYDSIPTVDADFAKAEQLRAQRESVAKKQTAVVNKYVKAIEATTNKDDFIKAADDFALYVVGEQKFPEVTPRRPTAILAPQRPPPVMAHLCSPSLQGVKVKDLVSRISETYDSLPKQRYYCEATRTNQGVCYTPGKVRRRRLLVASSPLPPSPLRLSLPRLRNAPTVWPHAPFSPCAGC